MHPLHALGAINIVLAIISFGAIPLTITIILNTYIGATGALIYWGTTITGIFHLIITRMEGIKK